MACLTQDIAIFPPIPHQYFRADDLELKSVFTCPEINFGRGPSENELPIPRTCDQKCQKIFRLSKSLKSDIFEKMSFLYFSISFFWHLYIYPARKFSDIFVAI